MNSAPSIKFSPGRIVIAPAALMLLSAEDIQTALNAHVNGEWGDLGKQDREENDQALAKGRRLLSVYHTDDGTKFWIITESDRSVTNVFLREIRPSREVEGMFKTRARNLVRRLNKLTVKPATGEPAIKLRFCVR
jgi:hypothetical protein